MPFYRILQNIWVNENTYRKRGQIMRLDMSPDKLKRLGTAGAIAPLRPPDLDDLPDWVDRLKILKRHRIRTVEELFEALEDDPVKVASWFDDYTEDDVIHWKQELTFKYLQVER